MDPSEHQRILVVEDDPAFLKSMDALLTGAGYEVLACSSSTDSRLPQQISQADLIVLDLNLPGRNGLEVLQSIREDAETVDKPVLMLTAHDPMKYRLQGLALGADDYVLKPPNREELLLRVAGMLRRAGHATAEDHDSLIVVARPGGGRGFLDARDVTYVCSARNSCYAHTHSEQKLTSKNIGELAEQLGEKFVRVHRSYLVNPAKVRSARWLSSSAYVLEMDTAEETLVPVSRTYRSSVRSALGLAEQPVVPAT